MSQNTNSEQTKFLQEEIQSAIQKKSAINIKGGGSKNFIGLRAEAAELVTTAHSGIIGYEPTELVVTARSGTTLESLNKTLAENGQMLPFEPPGYGPGATLGGTVACGLSGPGRPYRGAARDYVLGCRVINGKAQTLRFGGEVMKNVAGYDVTRLMTGSMGTLGVLLDVSLKVLPLPETEATLIQETDINSALDTMQALAGKSLPVTAAAYSDGKMYTRLSGADSAVTTAAKAMNGDIIAEQNFWQQLKEHQLDFFTNNLPLWRLSLPPLTPILDTSGHTLYDWAGMQRWLYSEDNPHDIRAAVQSAGGHAQLFKASDELKEQAGTFHPLPNAVMQLQQKIKAEFDPNNIFNLQRLYPNL